MSVSLGTLSFARCHPKMMLKPGERNRFVLAASDAYNPDLLITAGSVVHSRKQLHQLARAISANERSGSIITEVQNDGQRRLENGHAMWAVQSGGKLHRFGRQAFGQSSEVRSGSTDRLDRLRRKLHDRSVAIGALTVFALCCGEINIVHGRDTPRFVDEEIGAAILAADIVINPTHDRMGNAGTLAAKRRFLSQRRPDGRPRAYVSCSNWEACDFNGGVQHPSPTLHTVYVSGEPQPYEELADGAFGFVYRQWQIEL